MPANNAPKPLLSLSMVSIARNFDSLFFNCKDKKEMGKLLEDDSFLAFEESYHKLPITVCSSLQETMRQQIGHLRKHHLYMLVHPYQSEFSFSYVGDKFFAINILENRCSRLQKLDLCYIRTINSSQLMKLIASLPHLTNLNLRMTDTCDQVMEQIGKNCRGLQSLDISMCSVTNNGIRRLCYDEVNKFGRCQKLTKLSMIDCMATSQSVWFLLHSIRTLREIEFDNILQVFSLDNIMKYQIEDKTTRKPFKLGFLTAKDEYISEINADMAVALCPLVTDISLSNCQVEHEVFAKILNLEYLKHLRIINNEEESIMFHDGILPIIFAKGVQLETLILCKFTTVDITAIGELCPNLKKLALSNITVYEDVLYPRENYFKKLTALEIWTNPSQDPVTSLLLKQLLYFCTEIQNILFSGCHCLTDELFLKIHQINKMKNLKRITIENCLNVSNVLIDSILFSKNEVNLIRIWNCFKITTETEQTIKETIMKHNLDIYFEWYH